MEVHFLHDPDTGLPHIEQHGVEPVEVLDILRRPAFGGRGRDDTLIAEGQTSAGRFLRVIYKRDDDDQSLLVIPRMISVATHYGHSGVGSDGDPDD